jgi:hypothetical protein
MKMTPLRQLLLAVGVLAAGPPAAQAGLVTFNFEDQTFAETTPLAITVGSETAAFTSPDDPTGFTITSSLFSSLSLLVLQSPGENFVTNLPLVITFSHMVDSISLLFALDTQPAPGTLTLTTNTGDTVSAGGSVLGGSFLYPEGLLSYRGAPFTSVTLSSPVLSFAIDDLVVNQVPEPGGVALFGVGLAALRTTRRRPA